MHAESPRYRDLEFSEVKLGEIINRFHNTPLHGVILVAVDKRGIAGMFWGYVDEFFFGHDRYAADLLLYVNPDRRKGRVAYRLVKAFEEWAADRSALHIQAGISTGIDNEGYARFYERMGYIGSGIVLSKAVVGDV